MIPRPWVKPNRRSSVVPIFGINLTGVPVNRPKPNSSSVRPLHDRPSAVIRQISTLLG